MGKTLLEEIMIENFPNMGYPDPGCPENTKEMNSNRSTPRQIIIKMSKVRGKEIILKAAREKQLVKYKGTPIRLSADFSAEICRP